MPAATATATATARAVRYVPGTARSPLGTIYLCCRVTPGAKHAGVAALSDNAVELRVAAPARDGEANEAVVRLLGRVLQLRKSDLKITQGLKSRDKIVAVMAVPPLVNTGGADEQLVLQRVWKLLDEAAAERT